jgi:hypothetical protein
VRDAQHAVAGELQFGVALAVPLERRACVMESATVQLDDEALVGPRRVGLPAGDPHVRDRARQTGRPADAGELALQL